MPTRDVIFNIIGRDDLTPAANRAATGVESAAARISRAGDKMVAAGGKLTSHLTLPILAIGAASVKAATNFNASMTRIQTQAGGSARDVRVLSREVLALKNAQQGPTQLADALYHLKSVGMDNSQAMRALRAGMDLANVGGSNLEDTVNALAGAWRTGIKGAKNFHTEVKTLNAIVGSGNMKMPDLLLALGTGILPSAKTFGLTLKDVGAALALFTDEGVPADNAATRLRMSFALLGAPSKQAVKELTLLGLTTGSAHKQISAMDLLLQNAGVTTTKLGRDMRKPDGLLRAVQDLGEHLKKSGMNAVQQEALISRAFGGGRSSSAIMSMLNNADVLAKKYRQITHLQGSFDKSVKTQAATPAAQFARTRAELEKTGVLLGQQLLPIALTIAKDFESVAKGFSSLSPGMKHFVVEAGLGLAILGPVLSIGGRLTKVFGLLFKMTATGWRGFGTSARGAQAAATTVGTAAQGAAAKVDLASLQVKAAQLSESSAYERAAASIAVANANKARSAADSAKVIAASLRGTDSFLAADAKAAAADAEAFARAQQVKADAAVKSAATITAASIETTRALGRGTAIRNGFLTGGYRGLGGPKMRGGIMAAGLAYGIGGQFLGPAIAGHAAQGSFRNKAGTAVSDSATGALIGSFFGPEGTIAGALGGAAFGWFTSGAKARAQSEQRRLAAISKLLDPTVAAGRMFTGDILRHGRRNSLDSFNIAVGTLQKQGLIKAGGKAGLTEWDLAKAITGSNADFLRVNAIMRSTVGITQNEANALGALRAQFLQAGPAARELAFEQGRVLDSFFKSGTVAGLLTGKLENLNKAHLTGRQSQVLFKNATDAVTASVTANGKSLSTNSLFGQRNILAIKAAGVAAIQHAQAVYDQTHNLGLADKALASDRNALIKAATQAGLSKEAVKRLLDQLGVLGRTRPNVKITVDTATAERQVLGFRTWMRLKMGGNLGGAGLITVQGAGLPAKTGTQRYPGAGQHWYHRAAGGPVYAGMPYWVGEHGPEPFIPSQNGTILPNRPATHASRPVQISGKLTLDVGGGRTLDAIIQDAVLAEFDFAAGQ